MGRLAGAQFAFVIVTTVAVGFLSLPTLAEAASKSKTKDVALKNAIVACKAEAKGKKVKWLGRRKFVNQCVAEILKDRPKMDLIRLLKDHPDMKELPMQNWDAI